MTPNELTESLNWRYATKQFDPDQKIPAEAWEALESSLVLSPSSFGLQPWKFIVITDSVLREKLKEASWNQGQVTDASHLVVFASQRSVLDEDVDRFLNLTARTRGIEADSLLGYRQMIQGFLSNMSAEQMHAWTMRQTYIALGQFMTSAAAIKVDTCPLEGINPATYDELLGLKDSKFSTIVACAAGYRHPDDKYATAPKVRYDAADLIARFD